MDFKISTTDDTIRNLSSIITFPAGSIYELKDKTVMILGPDFWKDKKFPTQYRTIRDYRLEKHLRVQYFLEPPGMNVRDQNTESKYYIPSKIFPDLQVCTECHKLFSYKKSVEELNYRVRKLQSKIDDYNYKFRTDIKVYLPSYVPCPSCSLRDVDKWDIERKDFLESIKNINKYLTKSVSFRWIYVCVSGHISDIPFYKNSVINHKENCKRDNYEFKAKQASFKFSEYFVICKDCYESVQMTKVMRGGFLCEGNTPWKFQFKSTDETEIDKCESKVIVALKGDSVVCMPNVMSSIQIPPYNIYQRLNDELIEKKLLTKIEDFEVEYWDAKENKTSILSIENVIQNCINFIRPYLSKDLSIPNNILRNFIIYYLENTNFQERKLEKDYEYRYHEYLTFFNNQNSEILSLRTQKDSINDFSIKTPYLRDLIIADRLTITVTTPTISRVNSEYYGDEEAKSISIKSNDVPWLPAVEVKGEGIIIDFKKNTLDSWYTRNKTFFETKLSLNNRNNYSIFYDTKEGLAKFYLLHSFAHYFINAMSSVCGYNSASLRERIYFSTDAEKFMNAVMITTSAGDSESSMGGLAYYGQMDHFLRIIHSTLPQLKICSNDPICSEGSPGEGNPNFAACYSCLILPETSCEFGNKYLDRNCLIGEGNGRDSIIGFFNEWITI